MDSLLPQGLHAAWADPELRAESMEPRSTGHFLVLRNPLPSQGKGMPSRDVRNQLWGVVINDLLGLGTYVGSRRPPGTGAACWIRAVLQESLSLREEGGFGRLSRRIWVAGSLQLSRLVLICLPCIRMAVIWVLDPGTWEEPCWFKVLSLSIPHSVVCLGIFLPWESQIYLFVKWPLCHTLFKAVWIRNLGILKIEQILKSTLNKSLN